MKAPVRNFLSIFSYFFVGLGATIVEWAAFYLLSDLLALHYLPAAAAAIIVSTFSNWIFGRLLTFRNAQKQNVALEIGKVYLAGAGGLLLNMLILWLLVEKASLPKMLSKIIATGIVFFYNYFARRIWIYKRR